MKTATAHLDQFLTTIRAQNAPILECLNKLETLVKKVVQLNPKIKNPMGASKAVFLRFIQQNEEAFTLFKEQARTYGDFPLSQKAIKELDDLVRDNSIHGNHLLMRCHQHLADFQLQWKELSKPLVNIRSVHFANHLLLGNRTE